MDPGHERKQSPGCGGVNAKAHIFHKPRHWRPATRDYFVLFVPNSCQGLLITSAPGESWGLEDKSSTSTPQEDFEELWSLVMKKRK
jgi:hypothetical protein